MQLCTCINEQLFFIVDNNVSCSLCGGRSLFSSTLSRVTLAQSSTATRVLDTAQHPMNQDSSHRSSRNIARNCKRRNHNAQPGNGSILHDITGSINNVTPPPRNPLCMEARPSDREINAITQVNNMLSNFVVTYFFDFWHINFQTSYTKNFFSISSKAQEVGNNLCIKNEEQQIIRAFLNNYQTKN